MADLTGSKSRDDDSWAQNVRWTSFKVYFQGKHGPIALNSKAWNKAYRKLSLIDKVKGKMKLSTAVYNM